MLLNKDFSLRLFLSILILILLGCLPLIGEAQSLTGSVAGSGQIIGEQNLVREQRSFYSLSMGWVDDRNTFEMQYDSFQSNPTNESVSVSRQYNSFYTSWSRQFYQYSAVFFQAELGLGLYREMATTRLTLSDGEQGSKDISSWNPYPGIGIRSRIQLSKEFSTGPQLRALYAPELQRGGPVLQWGWALQFVM